jgi:hypothetical protein
MSQAPLFPNLIQRDTRANQPAANAVSDGTLYCVTDEDYIIERSNGSAWQEYSPAAGGTFNLTVDDGTTSVSNVDTINIDGNAVTNDGGGAITITAGVPSGTANPAQPAYGDNRPFWRTDLDFLIFYDGTQWLTCNQYTISLGLWATTIAGTTGLTATTANALAATIPLNPAYDFYGEWFECTTNVAGTNTGAVFWTLALRKISTASSSTIVSFSTGTTPDTPSTYTTHRVAINALFGTSHTHLAVDATETGSAGNLFLPPATVVGRLKVT